MDFILVVARLGSLLRLYTSCFYLYVMSDGFELWNSDVGLYLFALMYT